jgi:hypothetical protein
MDRGPIQRVRRSLIGAGVATRESSEDEIEERASVILRAVKSIDRSMRPALTADGRGDELSTGDLLRRLASIADAAEGSPRGRS